MPSVEGVQHRTVPGDGVRLHLAEAGSGPPLLLLHGWPQHWWAWRRVIPALAAERRLLALDLRGWGWSEAPDEPPGPRTFVRDVLAVLDAEGLERVDVLAHDWGAWTAYLLALEHPERVRRAIALDVPPPWHRGPGQFAVAAVYQTALVAPWLGPRTMTARPGVVPALIRLGSDPRTRWTREELEVYAGVLRDPARARFSTGWYRTLALREAPRILRGGYRAEDLRVPMLAGMGRASPFALATRVRPTAHLRVEKLAAAGHFVPEEAPAQVVELVRSFLAPE